MNKIIIKNNKDCQLITEDTKVLNSVKKALSYKALGVEYTQAYKNGWNGVTCLLNKKGIFGLGLLGHIKKTLPDIEFEIVDSRKEVLVEEPLDLSDNFKKNNMSPRDHQIRILDAVIKNDKGIIRSCTGSGKCNNIDSINLTELGMLSYRELSEQFNVKLNPGEALPIEMEVSTPLNSGKDTASMIYCDGQTMSKKIATRYGYSVTGTLDHKIKVIDANGDLSWKRMEDLVVGDYVAISHNNQMFGKEKMSNDEAYFLGLLVGDGGLTRKEKITITNMDKHIIDFSTKYMKSINLNPIHRYGKSKAIDIIANSVKYRKYLLDMGFGFDKSTTKKIPKHIRMLEKEPLSKFIRGIYETDGWVEFKKNGSVCICLALSNKILIEQIQLILLNFGIVCSKSMKKTSRNDSYKLSIYAGFIDKFMKEIGLDPNGHKYKRVISAPKKSSNNNVDLIPNQCKAIKNMYDSLKKEKLSVSIKDGTIDSWFTNDRKPSRFNLVTFVKEFELKYGETVDSIKIKSILFDDVIFLKIEKIEDVMSDNYDFSIPNTHSFVSQGFINHNTMVAAMMTAQFNKPTIIYVIGLDLLQQFHNLFSKMFDEEIGWIGNGIINPKRITIASIWSLGSALDFKKTMFLDDEVVKELPTQIQDKKKVLDCLKNAKVHIIDECHACTCDTIQEIYKFINPERIYGLSGTPYRDDGSDLLVSSILGEVIIEISASELISIGLLTEPVIKFKHVPFEPISLRTYGEVYKQYIVLNETRNSMILDEAKKLISKGYKTLVLFKTIEHGKILLEMFNNENINCELLNGSDSLDRRNEVKARLEKGEIDCLIASTILDIGFDAPILSALVLAGSGKSKIRALQRIGRILRIFPNKKRAAVVDFMDNCRFLDKHSKIRYETYLTEPGFKILGKEK